MSWDLVLFNSRQIINSVEEIDEDFLEPTNFDAMLENHFGNIERHDNHRRIKGNDFEIEYFVDTENVSNKILNLYGEQGLFEIVILARQNGWQIFDTGLAQMITLDSPERNGYQNFTNYLNQILNNKK
ncbi:hypothetical protein QTN47_26360 [Danxiaibacter flavus]|uniref:Uncharacterized protein n=1 Tax=Danxiaibacter flavus TaxID=3049108 RepID=A0ABV3ZNE6_9BACT|nr:hypothetical protein QNM32_26360 [Chitinophagaceae bacterium DXS]